MLTTAISIAMLLLSLAIALNLWRLIIGPSLPDRILALDTMYINAIALLVLFGISLESMMMAEKAAEVEPFKTAITLKFDRQWWFVAYAVFLLVINIFTRKVYCRYVCPLGAALAIPTMLWCSATQ